MFDLKFYVPVLGYCEYIRIIKQNPAILTCGSKSTVKDHVDALEEQLGCVNECKYFCYYMKVYFNYFKINHHHCNM